jgi:hypothetical protein
MAIVVLGLAVLNWLALLSTIARNRRRGDNVL